MVIYMTHHQIHRVACRVVSTKDNYARRLALTNFMPSDQHKRTCYQAWLALMNIVRVINTNEHSV